MTDAGTDVSLVPMGFVTSTRHGLIIPLESKAEARCVTLELFLRGSRFFFLWEDEKSTPPKFNSSPLKNDGKGRRSSFLLGPRWAFFSMGKVLNFSGFKLFIDVLIYGVWCWSQLVLSIWAWLDFRNSPEIRALGESFSWMNTWQLKCWKPLLAKYWLACA